MVYTTETFSREIELLVSRGATYIDSIIDFCEKQNIEVEAAAKLINTKIKTAVSTEAANLNLVEVETVAQLPL